jgi:hypothetical protein
VKFDRYTSSRLIMHSGASPSIEGVSRYRPLGRAATGRLPVRGPSDQESFLCGGKMAEQKERKRTR